MSESMIYFDYKLVVAMIVHTCAYPLVKESDGFQSRLGLGRSELRKPK